MHLRYLDLCTLTDSILALFEPRAHARPSQESEPAPHKHDSADAEAYISQLLLHLGIPPHVQGYKFLRQAMLETLAAPQVLDNLTHSLYPAIAAQFGTAAPRVERSIRHAIEMAWAKHGPDAFRRLQPQSRCQLLACPTVREFLAMVTERVRIHMMHRG